MANQLTMALVNAIWTLKQRGWSQRRIARGLGINRETVAWYVQLHQVDLKPATNAPTGSADYRCLSFGPGNCVFFIDEIITT